MVRIVLLDDMDMDLRKSLSASPVVELIPSWRMSLTPDDIITTFVPDLAILPIDESLAFDPFAMISFIRKQSPRTQVIVILTGRQIDALYTTICRGAIGYIFREESNVKSCPAIIDTVIHLAAARHGRLNHQLARVLIKHLGLLYILRRLNRKERTILHAYASQDSESRVAALHLDEDILQSAIGTMFAKIAKTHIASITPSSINQTMTPVITNGRHLYDTEKAYPIYRMLIVTTAVFLAKLIAWPEYLWRTWTNRHLPV